MQLTFYTDYGLRTLMYLATQRSEQLSTISEISELLQIPRNHLVKIVHRLGKEGWIKTVRGKGGGISIGDNALELKLGDIVARLEKKAALIDCNDPPCPLNRGCSLSSALHLAYQAFLNVLNEYTLGQVVGESEQLLKLITPVQLRIPSHTLSSEN